jgi:hypothetical protein
LYQDDLAKIVVDVPDLKRNRDWMKLFKSRWKRKLDQLEIWMISYASTSNKKCFAYRCILQGADDDDSP